MQRIVQWLARHAPDVHRSLSPLPPVAKLQEVMTTLGPDASPALEAWLLQTGGQDWANSPDAAMPPWLLLSADEIIHNTRELRELGQLPPRAAAVIAYDFDDWERYLLLDTRGVLWELREGETRKVAGSIEEWVSDTADRLVAEKPQLRGWSVNDRQTASDAKTWLTLATLALIAVSSLSGAIYIASTHPVAAAGWGLLALAIVALLVHFQLATSLGRARCRDVARDAASHPDAPWHANKFWRRNEGFPITAGAPPLKLAAVPIPIDAPATATIGLPGAEATLECVQILMSPAYWGSSELDDHSTEAQHEPHGTVITFRIPESWPTRLPGHYPNRAILWQITVRHNGRAYQYWLPAFD